MRSESARFFRRREDKYEIGLPAAALLQADIVRRLPLFEYHPGYPHTFVTTIYFDTRNRDFYRRAERHYDDNVKIRVKEYYYSLGTHFTDTQVGPPRASLPKDSNGDLNGDPPVYQTSSQCYVELKQSLNGTVIKKRFGFPKKDLSLLFGGQDVWPILLKVTPSSEIPPLREIYRELKRYLNVYHIEVTSIVNYRRTVYQENEEDLRITFDDSLAVYPPLPALYDLNEALTSEVLGNPIRKSDKVILEIKCPAEYPDWLKSALQFHSSKRLSKFTTSVRFLLGSSAPFEEGQSGGNSSN